MIFLFVFVFIHLVFILLFPYPAKANPSSSYSQIIILGCPCLDDGSLSDAQLRRLHAALYYYQMSPVASIIITGGNVKNEYVEAQVMAKQLQALLPTAHIETETNARNTYQNMKLVSTLFPSEDVLIISGSAHLRRAYFFARKFYRHIAMGYGNQQDPWCAYLLEYTRMWVALYWEVKLYFKK